MTGTREIDELKKVHPGVARAPVYHRPRRIPLRVVVPIKSAARENAAEKVRAFVQTHVMFLSRLSLATVFFWFGILKVANVSPAAGLLRGSIPFLANSPYVQLLGGAEIVIGIGLLVNPLTKTASLLMILHLLGTFSLFLIAPRLMFAPAFPELTMAGEFVLKNIVLLIAALIIMCSRPPRTWLSPAKPRRQTSATFANSLSPRADRRKAFRG